MTTVRQNIVWIAGLATIFLAPLLVRAQEPLERAKALYASAQFADALAVLTGIRPATRAETVGAAKTRALCLIALGRAPEAEGAFETLVEADPLVRLTEAEVSPRVRELFGEVRQRVLPSLVKERFAAAKTLFSEGKRDEAAVAFKELRPLLDDSDLAKMGTSDLRVLVDGFLALTSAADDAPASASAPSPVPLEVAPAPSEPAANSDGASTPNEETDGDGAAAPGGTAAGEDTTDAAADVPPSKPRAATPPEIIPPVVISQKVPPPRGITLNRQPATLALEVLIDEQGRVERAAVTQPLHPIYDALVLDAAESWQYKPATRDGQPVKFLKAIEITVRP
ncbi:MAG: TonB family protein [Luteitalea sp.]|nr:TonB family protein [Luteitalea sp.]